jgi:hypothetical protein
MPSNEHLTYDVGYAERGTTLVLKIDLDRGWRDLKKTYGFFEQKKIRYKGDWSIRTQVSLIAQPATFNYRAASFPVTSLKGGDHLFSYSLDVRQLTVKVALNEHQPWRMMSTGRPGLFIEELPLLHTQNLLSFDLRVWVVFHEPNPTPPRDVREWCQRLFVPGGHFESNRRRH